MDGEMQKMHSAVFTVCRLDNRYNKLYPAITEQQKRSHFAGLVDNSFAVAVSRGRCNSAQKHEPCICVNIVVLDCDPLGHAELHQKPKHTETNTLVIFCTDTFLSHYGFTESITYYVQLIRPSPLTKITLATDSVQAFTWASSHIFSTGLLLNVCNQHNVIARTGDIFAIPYSQLFEHDDEFDISFLSNLEVVETEPFYQGAVMVNTEILILNKTALQKKECKISMPKSDTRKPAAVHVSDFAVPLTSVFIPRQVNRPTLYRDARNTVCLQRDWNVLPYQYLHTVRHAVVESGTNHTIYAYVTTLKRCSLFNDSLIEVVLEADSVTSALIQQNPSAMTRTNVNQRKPRSKLASVSRVVHLKALQPEVKDVDVSHHEEGASCMHDKLFLPCSLLFNLQRGYTKHIGQDLLIKIRKYQPESVYLTSMSTSWNGDLPYAREVYVSCVYSPQYSTGTAYSTVLQKYFLTPKTLQKDDVFAVNTSIDIEFTQNSEGGNNIFPVVYFKVKRITPRMKKKTQTYLVDADHSALYQDGPCHSYIPSCLDRMTHSSPNHLTVPGLSHHINKLTELIQPYLSKWCQSAESAPAILLHGSSGCGKMSICQAIASACNMHYFRVNCHDLCGETSSATETRILQTFMRACMYSPCVLHLRNIHALGKDRDGNNEDSRVSSYFRECIENILHKESPDWPVVILATTSNLNSLTPDMHAGFLHTFEIEVPNQSARKVMLESLLNDVRHIPSLSLDRITQRTAGFVLGDLDILVAEAKKEAYRKVLKFCFPGNTTPSPQDEYCVSVCEPVLSQSDFDVALDKLQAAHSDAIGAPKIPNVTWADVGGLTSVKADILDTLQLPLQHPELFTAGLHRSGVLLFGPPGTGKTLLAKAVATECSLNFLSVKGPELINMYVGQSEENIREVFSRARNATPCVIFFDELDSLAPNRGRSGDSGGVMDRVVSQLLAELDGLQKSCDVFVIGATNRPDLLDPALLRPGRFDKLLYLGVSEDKETKLHILKALTRKFNLSPLCDLSNIVDKCPDNMTGADFYALCSDAMLNALKREIHKIETGVSTCEEMVEVSDADFSDALKDFVPSISKTELDHYKQLQYSLMAGK